MRGPVSKTKVHNSYRTPEVGHWSSHTWNTHVYLHIHEHIHMLACKSILECCSCVYIICVLALGHQILRVGGRRPIQHSCSVRSQGDRSPQPPCLLVTEYSLQLASPTALATKYYFQRNPCKLICRRGGDGEQREAANIEFNAKII